jgi:ribosomal protein S18 acetylase RimI-like enzyme
MQLTLVTLPDLDQFMPLMEGFYTHFGYPFERAEHRLVVENFLENPHLGSLWFIETEDERAGYLALTYGFTFEFLGRDAFVDELFVLEPFRNRGFGEAALKQIQVKAPELGLVAIHLQTESYNTRAKRLYEQVGFNDKGRATLTWLV